MRRWNPVGAVRAAASVPASTRRRKSAGLVAALSLTLVAGGALITAAPAQADVTDGLVLRYKLDETSGTVAHDSSGNGRDGTVNGTADWKGADGLRFNGSNTYVKVPDNIMAGLSSITVDFDVWIDPTMGKPYGFYGFGNTNGSNGNGYLFTTGNSFRTSISMTDYTAKQDTIPSNTSYQLARGMWKHVTYTQTGNTGVLYENGVEKARTTNVTITPGAIGGGTTTADYLGRSLYANDLYFKGRMRDFRVYNRALSSAEVQSVANETEEHWEQAQELASYNGALDVFQDSTVGPVIIFPSDYTGDIDNLSVPTDWTDAYGNVPTSWPTFTTAKSPLFTVEQIATVEDAVTAQVQPNGDLTYRLDITYDGTQDRVVARTNAPASVTDPLATQYVGRLVIESDTTPSGKCRPDQTSVANSLATIATPADGTGDVTTELQWKQVQALADYNCALTAFDDPNIGPVIIFPSDYTGDINNLQKPPGWTDQYGQVPADWPAPTTAKSPQFTVAQIQDIQTSAVNQIAGASSDTTNYSVTVHYDGPSDRVVVETDAPASVTGPLLTTYPNKVVIATPSTPPLADN